MRKMRQAEFRFPNGWGGRRRGAGRRPKGERAGVSHRRKGRLARRFPVHVTMRLRDGLPSLRRRGEYAVLLGAFASGKERFGFRLVHFVVLGNHLHLMTEAEDRRAHSRGMQGLAVRIAKRLNKYWDRSGKVFADRFHGRLLRTPREVRNGLRYLFHNAVRHGIRVRAGGARTGGARTGGARAGAGGGPDAYSSGRWFDGWRGWQGGREGPGWRPVVRARSWLLRLGWRRWGLIELEPGSWGESEWAANF